MTPTSKHCLLVVDDEADVCDSGSLADAVMRVISDREVWQRASDAAVSAIATRFSVDQTVTELESYYQAAVSATRRA